MNNSVIQSLEENKAKQLLNRLPLIKPLSALLLSSVLCCLMVTIRYVRMDSLKYGFLIWNLFLAWTPLLFAYLLKLKNYPTGFLSMPNSIVGKKEKFIFLALFSLWLLFFPNAPYIVSDLIHLRWNKGTIIWFDAVLFFCFAATGLQVGLLSLYLIQKSLEEVTNRWLAFHIIAGSIWLSGFGIYMGRDLRINSWDLFTQPIELIQTTIHKLSIHGVQMTMVYAVLIGTVYLIFKSLLTTTVD